MPNPLNTCLANFGMTPATECDLALFPRLGVWPNFGLSPKLPFDAKVMAVFLVGAELSNDPSLPKNAFLDQMWKQPVSQNFSEMWIIQARQDPQTGSPRSCILVCTHNSVSVQFCWNENRLWQWTVRMKFILWYKRHIFISRVVPLVWVSITTATSNIGTIP